MKKNNSICIIIVNYESDNYALELIKSINSQNFIENIKIILVDNSERKSSSKLFNKIKNKNIISLKAPENLGYFGGARLGFKKFKELNDKLPEYLIVCNSDVYFKSKIFFQKLVNHKYNSNIGVIAPAIISNQLNADKNPKIQKRPSNIKMHLYKILFYSRISQNFYILLHLIKYSLLKLFKKLMKQKNSKHEYLSKKIYAPHGSLIIFTKNYFQNGGSLDYPCFLFNEEVFVAETVRELKMQILYDNELVVYDNEHVSTGIMRSRKIAKYVSISSKYIAEKYFSRV
tara:strand:- start:7476 stop:8336 length:861 start_codon:yes stop_codon:yes gene_type:complete